MTSIPRWLCKKLSTIVFCFHNLRKIENSIIIITPWKFVIYLTLEHQITFPLLATMNFFSQPYVASNSLLIFSLSSGLLREEYHKFPLWISIKDIFPRRCYLLFNYNFPKKESVIKLTVFYSQSSEVSFSLRLVLELVFVSRSYSILLN